MRQQPGILNTQITKTAHLNYLLYLPTAYGQDTNQRWPLILFLHGSGERGSNLDLVKLYGLPKKLEAGAALPFIVVSPQCPADSYWLLHLDELKALVEDIAAHYAVDAHHIYLTGLSMGGTGAWMLGAAFPDLFAAMIPIGGRAVPSLAKRFKNLPVWAFHGEEDEVVPADESRRMVKALQALDADVTLTIYPGVGHNSWTQTYDNPDIYTWLLRYSR